MTPEVHTRRLLRISEVGADNPTEASVSPWDGSLYIGNRGAGVVVHKDAIKALAVFLLNEIGETPAAVEACSSWAITDDEGDNLEILDNGGRLVVRLTQVHESDNGVYVTQGQARQMAAFLSEWADRDR